MKKMKFNVLPKENINIPDLIKEINKISCRISFNLEYKIVTVKDVADDVIEIVINLIDKNYIITNIDIDNLVIDVAQNEEQSISQETKTVSKPVDNLVEFKEHPDLIEKLGKTLNWALTTMNVPEKFIANYVYGMINDISMTYSTNSTIDFKVGDVVECSFGYNMPGETNGRSTHAIVCNIYKEMAFVVPITKYTSDYVISSSFVEFTPKVDIKYNSFPSVGGSVLLDKGRYINNKRIKNVIGKTSSGFMKRILNELPETFNFVKPLQKH